MRRSWDGGPVNWRAIRENIVGFLIVCGIVGAGLWWGWTHWLPAVQDWAAPKPFASVDGNFVVGKQYRTLAECESESTYIARTLGNDPALKNAGCVNLAADPKRLVFVAPKVPEDWSLTFTHPGTDNTDTVGHYPTLRDCLLAAIPLVPNGKTSLGEAGLDCQYGPAQEPTP